jgi:hypothetical protein
VRSALHGTSLIGFGTDTLNSGFLSRKSMKCSVYVFKGKKVKVKVILEQAAKAQRGRRDIPLLFP